MSNKLETIRRKKLEELHAIERQLEGMLEDLSAALSAVQSLDEECDQSDVSRLDSCLDYYGLAYLTGDLEVLIDEEREAEQEDEEKEYECDDCGEVFMRTEAVYLDANNTCPVCLSENVSGGL